MFAHPILHPDELSCCRDIEKLADRVNRTQVDDLSFTPAVRGDGPELFTVPQAADFVEIDHSCCFGSISGSFFHQSAILDNRGQEGPLAAADPQPPIDNQLTLKA